jgi:heme A synthase
MASLDASTGQGEARIVDSALRRGVRLELVVAPVSFLLPAFIGWVFVDLGQRNGDWRYVALGLVVFGGNVVFDFLMVRTALRYLRRTRPPRPAAAGR